MSTRRGSTSKGAPKHQNRTAWKPNAAVKINDRELGGKLHPYPAVNGVCTRCKDQILWRRKYGKYKPLTEPAKCNQCGKRTVRDAYHAICAGCARERNVCGKCCHPADIDRGAEDKENERMVLEQALKELRERDRRTLLRAMSKGNEKGINVVLKKGDQNACGDDRISDSDDSQDIPDSDTECQESGNSAIDEFSEMLVIKP